MNSTKDLPLFKFTSALWRLEKQKRLQERILNHVEPYINRKHTSAWLLAQYVFAAILLISKLLVSNYVNFTPVGSWPLL